MLTGVNPGTEAARNLVTAMARLPRWNSLGSRSLWHEPEQATSSLGCSACPDRKICGGLRLKGPIFDCLQFCCGNAADCDRVCRKHPEYPNRVREVETFALSTVARSPAVAAPDLPRVVPVIYHRTGRCKPPVSETVALPLYSLFNRSSGRPRYASPDKLCEKFCLRVGSTILLTGTARDRPLERWWELGAAKRRTIIQALHEAGVGLVASPNYSLFIDRPRWDDLHAMKRIAITHGEFLHEGMPAALHVNGRTESDFQRWTDYLGDRTEITHLAYEFTTGTGRKSRRKQHSLWLAGLAAAIGRPLHLVLRGGTKDILPILARAFADITVLDTSTFIKTMKRQRAVQSSNSKISWASCPTEPGAPVDELFDENCRTVEAWLGDLITAATEGAQRGG